MEIDVSRRNPSAAKIDRLSAGRNPARGLRGNLQNFPVLDEQQRMFHHFGRSDEPVSGQGQHKIVLIEPNCGCEEDCTSP